MSPDRILYRGYRLEVSRQGPGWKALIYAPGSALAEPNFPRNRAPNGRDAVIAEAKAIVDAKLGLNP